jgi:hypothetical protein
MSSIDHCVDTFSEALLTGFTLAIFPCYYCLKILEGHIALAIIAFIAAYTKIAGVIAATGVLGHYVVDGHIILRQIDATISATETISINDISAYSLTLIMVK